MDGHQSRVERRTFLSAFEVKEDKPEAVVELIEELMAEVRGVAGTGHLILPDRLKPIKRNLKAGLKCAQNSRVQNAELV